MDGFEFIYTSEQVYLCVRHKYIDKKKKKTTTFAAKATNKMLPVFFGVYLAVWPRFRKWSAKIILYIILNLLGLNVTSSLLYESGV